MIKIKICGMRHKENTEQTAALAPDYMGFIFYEFSERCIRDRSLLNLDIFHGIKKTAVFVDQPLEDAMEIISEYSMDAVQLHGKESPEYCNNLKTPAVEIIKAFAVDDKFNFSVLKKYRECCDYFLFDTKTEKPGGSGKQFNRDILKAYNMDKPFFISGGIGLEDLEDIIYLAKKIPLLYGVDMNSRLEISPGLKDLEKTKEAIHKLK